MSNSTLDNISIFDNGSQSDDWVGANDSDALSILRVINFWLLLVIIVVGFSGNIFAVVAIASSSKLRRVSSNHYLVALALSDNVFVFGLFMIWLNKLGAPTYHYNTAACKLVLFLLNSSGCLSSWYIMVLTIERFVVVYYPLYRRAICSVGRTRRTIAALVPWPLLFNVWVLFAGGLLYDIPGHPLGICDIYPDYYHLSLILNGIDMAVSFVVPVLVIFAFNTAICIRLWMGEHKQFSAAAPSTTSEPKRGGSMMLLSPKKKRVPTLVERDDKQKGHFQLRALKQGAATPAAETGGGGACNEEMRKHAGANAKIQRQERKITKTLLIISFVYVALNMPSYSVRLRDSLMVAMGATASDMSLLEKIVRNVFLMIYYTNFALNFIVYSLSSKNFRDAVKNLWRRRGSSAGVMSANMTYSTVSKGGSGGHNQGASPSHSATPSARNSPHLSAVAPRRFANGEMSLPPPLASNSTCSTLGLVGTPYAIDDDDENRTPPTANGSTSANLFVA